MKTRIKTVALALSCVMAAGAAQAKTELHLQRFFGTCEAEYGQSTDVANATGECGIMTTLLNKFQKENPDIDLKVSTVEWPGYDQLTAQMASRTPPDIVTMHDSVISDYQSRHLIVPVDTYLNNQHIKESIFTPTATQGVKRDGQFYGVPLDTWTMLFHINTKLMKQAGLMKDGKPILPNSPEELLEQARQFKKATGKPYLIQILSNETASYVRLFYTYMFQQDSDFFANPKKVQLVTPEAKNIVRLFKQIYDENLTTKHMDYPASFAAFGQGEGGISLNGNWLIGAYDKQSHNPKSPLYNAYDAEPYPYLYHKAKANYVDGHAWVVPNKPHTDDQQKAIGRFFKFFINHDYQWARTGHLPSISAVLKKPEFLDLPHRKEILSVTHTGHGLPNGVQRQFTVQSIIGEELAAAITGEKPIDAALKSAQYRVNDMLANL